MARQNPRPIVLKSRPELTLEVEAGRLVQFGLHPTMVVLPPMVHEAQLRCDPADTALDDHETQLGKTLRYRGGDQQREAALHHEHLVVANLRMERDAALDRQGLIVGAAMYGDRQIQLL